MSIQVKLPEDLMKYLSALDEKTVDRIIVRSLQAGARAAKNVYKASLQSVLSPQHKRGELVKALTTSKPKLQSDGTHYVLVKFKEPRQDQSGSMTTRSGKRRSYYVRTNAMIGNVLEYGSSRIAARPWFRPADKKAIAEATEKVISTFDEGVTKGG